MDAPNYTGQGTIVYAPQISENGRKFPNFEELSAKWDSAGEYVALFPNALLGIHRDHYFAIILTPDGPDKTIEQVEIYYTSPQVLSNEFDDMRATNSTMWRTVFAEDIQMVEGMQKGRHASAYDGGKFSAVMDGPTHHFHKWVAHRLGSPA
jgi:phenylpropionate dioxygenase-like ring-hydroxylating dioxygenase large terminal subunit